MERVGMGGPRCAVHGDVVARAQSCERCGNFACDACFGDPTCWMCASCREATGYHPTDAALDPNARAMRQWMRKNPRLAGLLSMGIGFGCVALNLALIVFLERFYVMLFPLGLGVAGLGLATMITGRAGVARFADAPLSYWVITMTLALGGLFAGFGLTWLVS